MQQTQRNYNQHIAVNLNIGILFVGGQFVRRWTMSDDDAVGCEYVAITKNKMKSVYVLNAAKYKLLPRR